MATRKSLLDSIPDYEAIYNKAYDEVMKEKVDLRKYFSKDHLETMPELEKIVFVNRLQNYLILTKLGLNMGTPDFLPRTQQQKKMAFMNRTDSDENWTPAMGRRKTNTGKGRQSARWQAGNSGVSQGKEVMASASSDGSLPPELRTAGKQQPFMGFRRVLARRLLHHLQHELTWKKFLRQTLANRLIDADECEVLDPSDGLTLEKAMKKKQADYRNELRNRYPRRNIPEKNYKELEVPNEDEYILCEECNEEYLRGNCPVHGAVEFVKDKTVQDDYPRKKRRQHETGVMDVPQNRVSKSIPDGLVIAPSTMPGAGLGVWTKRAFSRGTMFGPYGGVKVYSEMDAHASGYTWEIYKDGQLDHYIDAQDVSKSSWMRYVNCATSKSVQNVKAFQFSGGIYYRACVDIPVNVEMVVWYGEEYAEELGLLAKQTKSLGCCGAVGGITMSLPPVRAISRTAEQHGLKTAPFVADQNQTREKETGYRNDVVPCALGGSDKQQQIQDVERLRRQYRDGKERPHQCSMCIKAFTWKGNLIRHMRIHTGEKLYTCTVCGLKCVSQGNLNRHMRIHTGERPYACTVCEAKFSQVGNLKGHMVIHTGETPYRCSVCAVNCSHRGHLDIHMRMHTGERPYACTVCEVKFSQLGTLTRHMVIHTGERPYTCTLCGVKFRYSHQLKRHKGQHS